MPSPAGLLVLGALLAPAAVRAQSNCYWSYGRRYCNGRSGLAYGVRIAIGVAIAAAFVVLMMLLVCLRRRKVHRANLVYAQQQQQQYGQQSYQLPHQGGVQGAFFPQYQNPQQQQHGMFNKFSRNDEDVQPPPPAYNPSSSGPDAGSHAQPQYAPPAGPPPGFQGDAAAAAGHGGYEPGSAEAREWAQHQENLRTRQA